jgi:hypothetical protein
MAITTKTTRGAATGAGRTGGRGRGPKPKTTSVTKKKQAKPARESTPTLEENNSNHGNGVEVSPTVREAIAHEVY